MMMMVMTFICLSRIFGSYIIRIWQGSGDPSLLSTYFIKEANGEAQRGVTSALLSAPWNLCITRLFELFPFRPLPISSGLKGTSTNDRCRVKVSSPPLVVFPFRQDGGRSRLTVPGHVIVPNN